MRSSTIGPVFLAALTLGLAGNRTQWKKDLYALNPSIETKGKLLPEFQRGQSQSARKQQAALIPRTGQQEYNIRTIQMVKG